MNPDECCCVIDGCIKSINIHLTACSPTSNDQQLRL